MWRGGDELRYRLSVFGAQGEERWELRLVLLDPLPGETLLAVPLRAPPNAVATGDPPWLESALLPVDVLIRREGSSSTRTARSEVPEAFLRTGLAEVCAAERARAPSTVRGAELVLMWTRARAALDGLARAMRENAVLADLLARSIEVPPLLVLLLHKGPLVSFELEPQLPASAEPAPVDPPDQASNGFSGPHGMSWKVDATLVVAGRRALEVELLVGESDPVHALGAGIRAFVARSTTDPTRRIEASLVEARRGAGAVWTLPAAADLAGER